MKKFYKIILVDDCEVDNFINQTVIEKMGVAAQVQICSNGNEAIEVIKKANLDAETQTEEFDGEVADLILLDINMPGMNGFEVLKELKTFNKKPFSIVLLSCSEHIRDLTEASRLNIDYYINKPLTIEKMQKMMDRCL